MHGVPWGAFLYFSPIRSRPSNRGPGKWVMKKKKRSIIIEGPSSALTQPEKIGRPTSLSLGPGGFPIYTPEPIHLEPIGGPLSSYLFLARSRVRSVLAPSSDARSPVRSFLSMGRGGLMIQMPPLQAPPSSSSHRLRLPKRLLREHLGHSQQLLPQKLSVRRGACRADDWSGSELDRAGHIRKEGTWGHLGMAKKKLSESLKNHS